MNTGHTLTFSIYVHSCLKEYKENNDRLCLHNISDVLLLFYHYLEFERNILDVVLTDWLLVTLIKNYKTNVLFKYI